MPSVWNDRVCYYVAPNYRQSKRIAWGVLKQLVPIEARCRSSEQELSIQLHNGSIIQLHGADNFDSLRGVGLDFVVLDEYAFMDPETWPMVVRPMLSDRKGYAFFISTPTRLNNFYDLYIVTESSREWEIFLFISYAVVYIAPYASTATTV